ncbi:MAG: DUF2917 domain-containing protein [Proteobacteria bacterium]|nr:DUF2917 domain-containing protein [Pseudomonadota bacterium]
MNVDLIAARRHLDKGDVMRLTHGAGRRIESLHGSLWITLDHDLRDIVLDAGEGYTVDGPGPVLVSALDDASFLLLDVDGGGRTPHH